MVIWISLYPGIAIGSYNECAISLQVTATNNSMYTTAFELYMVMLYSDVLQLYNNNLAQISNIPVSYSDIMNAHASEHAHRVVLRSPDITGSGMLSSLGNFLKSGKLEGIVKGIKSALNSDTGKAIRKEVKGYLRSHGHPKVADTLEHFGFGHEEMDGGAGSGGKKRRAKSRSRSVSRKRSVSRSVSRSRSRSRKAGRPRKSAMKGGAYASSSDLAESLYE